MSKRKQKYGSRRHQLRIHDETAPWGGGVRAEGAVRETTRTVATECFGEGELPRMPSDSETDDVVKVVVEVLQKTVLRPLSRSITSQKVVDMVCDLIWCRDVSRDLCYAIKEGGVIWYGQMPEGYDRAADPDVVRTDLFMQVLDRFAWTVGRLGHEIIAA